MLFSTASQLSRDEEVGSYHIAISHIEQEERPLIMSTVADNCTRDDSASEEAAVAVAAVSSDPPKSQQQLDILVDEEQRQQQQTKKSERARARWSILRSALLGAATTAGTTNASSTGGGNAYGDGGNDANESNSEEVNSASIHRFAGFQLLDRRVVNEASVVGDMKNTAVAALSACLAGSSNENDDRYDDGADKEDEDELEYDYEYAEYTIQVQLPPSAAAIDEVDTEIGTYNKTKINVRTKEKRQTKKQRVDLRGLLSHRLHGVDNTGQSCVWDSESTLTYSLFAGEDDIDTQEIILPLFLERIDNLLLLAAPFDELKTLQLRRKQHRVRVVELGAGMAGLAGLALAAFGLDNMGACGSNSRWDIGVTLTDGHPDAVLSNRICAELTSRRYGESAQNHISCQRLLWNDGAQGVADCQTLTNNGQDKYHLCLASDCVHFQEFHAALVATIGRLLDIGGVCLFCQPRRADSLDNFMRVIDAVNDVGSTDENVFDMQLFERYNQKLWDMHQKELAKNDGIYDPDIHFPLLLVLRKKGEWKEHIHAVAASKQVQDRKK